MKASATIGLYIGNAIPRGSKSETEEIIDLWKNLESYFIEKPFVARSGLKSEAKSYLITLNASPLLYNMKNAKAQSGVFYTSPSSLCR